MRKPIHRRLRSEVMHLRLVLATCVFAVGTVQPEHAD
jgi:hypothetical protein